LRLIRSKVGMRHGVASWLSLVSPRTEVSASSRARDWYLCSKGKRGVTLETARQMGAVAGNGVGGAYLSVGHQGSQDAAGGDAGNEVEAVGETGRLTPDAAYFLLQGHEDPSRHQGPDAAPLDTQDPDELPPGDRHFPIQISPDDVEKPLLHFVPAVVGPQVEDLECAKGSRELVGGNVADAAGDDRRGHGAVVQEVTMDALPLVLDPFRLN